MHELTDATNIELESATYENLSDDYTDNRTDEVEVSRWSKKGDRLYINGPAKYKKNSTFFDLVAGEMQDLPGSRDVTVERDGDTVTITVADTGGLGYDEEWTFVLEMAFPGQEDEDEDGGNEDDREVATDGGEEEEEASEDETTSEQDDVAESLSTKRLSDESREWTVEVDTINDGRPAVRVSWEPDTDASLPTVDEERLPHDWQIVQFGVGVSSEIGESDDKRYLVIAPQKANSEPAMYDALARELTASELRDYLAVERFGYSQTGWAKASGLNRSNVSERVNSARRKISK
ncbi:hypothetical protein [Haloterrigena salifodinae]|uniref:hypothetical protein n=1 Tax=Haloterrigena salifodinae TaxID=2675099 RepID=UPI000F89AF56|nr:hypothetical protein [Haloterrigena salifodinae]